MIFRLLADWIAVLPHANDTSHRATVVFAGPEIEECGPDDVVLIDPGAGFPITLNGKVHRMIDRQGLVAVIDADDELDDDMRPRYRDPAPDAVDEGLAGA